MTFGSIVPAELAFDGNGIPYAPAYGDSYHSASGGLEQARHVFIGGNDLPARWQGRDCFAILETGFGLGLNFLATWQAWRDDPQRPRQLHYFSVEQHPFHAADLARVHQPHGELAELSARLRAAWPALVAGFHRLHFEAGQVTLTLIFGAARLAVPRIDGRFDAFFLDGFAPDRNPEMWSAELIGDLAWLAAPGATLATWTVAGDLRRRLASAEFVPEKRLGFGNKREMTVASFVGTPQLPARDSPPRRAAIIGAGVAGVSCAERLARRGWQVDLFERRDGPAEETSGNRQAVMLPVLAVDPTRLARMNQMAFFYVLRRLDELAAAGHPVTWTSCGVFQIARHADHAKKQRAIVEGQKLPEDFVQFLDAETAVEVVGSRVADAGWWFPRAGWVAPVSLCQALLAYAGQNVTLHADTEITALLPSQDGWQLRDARGGTRWEGQTVVLAHAHGIRALEQSAHLPLRCFRGQTSHLPAAALGDMPRTVVCREGYLAPPHDGISSLGATFQRSHDLSLHVEDHAANLARLAGMLPEFAGRLDPASLDGRVGLRPVSPDKMPMLGALPLPACEPRPLAHVEWPRWPGLYIASGYGARGLVWAPLMAELLASQIAGEPLPVENELAAAVDPARFTWKGTT